MSRRPALLLDALQDSIRALPAREAVLLLSGGWDSRLLGALFVRKLGRESVTVATVELDKGRFDDVLFAQAVGKYLGTGHVVAIPAWRGYWSDMLSTAQRVSFQTSHHVWLYSLILELQSREVLSKDGVIPHGLGGDVLLKGSSLAPAAMIARDRDNWIEALWNGLAASGPTLQLLPRKLARHAVDAVRSNFEDEVSGFWDHPSRTSLAAYWTRGRRGIGLAIDGILDTVGTGVAPFTHPAFVATALTVPDRAKVDRGQYMAILDAIDPALSGLPSTSIVPGSGRSRLRREATVGVLERYIEVLRQPEIRPLWGKGLQRSIHKGRIGQLTESRRSASVLRGLVLLGLWINRYRRVLDQASLVP